MSGMKTAGGGGIGRQVQDASFFIGVLRGKMNDARAEVGRLRAEIERHDKDVSQQGHLERTYESMLQVGVWVNPGAPKQRPLAGGFIGQ